MWGCGVLPTALPAPFSATLSPALWVYLCTNVGPQGLLVVRLPAPFVPHSTSLGLPRQRESSLPWCPVSAPPTSLDECLFFSSLVLDFLVFRFSVISGCVRRYSVSTYATILVLPCRNFLINVSILSGVTALFRLSASSSLSFGRLYFSRNLFISCRFSNFLEYTSS